MWGTMPTWNLLSTYNDDYVRLSLGTYGKELSNSWIATPDVWSRRNRFGSNHVLEVFFHLPKTYHRVQTRPSGNALQLRKIPWRTNQQRMKWWLRIDQNTAAYQYDLRLLFAFSRLVVATMTIPRQYSTLQSRGRFNGKTKAKIRTGHSRFSNIWRRQTLIRKSRKQKNTDATKFQTRISSCTPSRTRGYQEGPKRRVHGKKATTTIPNIWRRTFLLSYNICASTLRRRTKVSTAGEKGRIERLHQPVDPTRCAPSRLTLSQNINRSNTHWNTAPRRRQSSQELNFAASSLSWGRECWEDRRRVRATKTRLDRYFGSLDDARS